MRILSDANVDSFVRAIRSAPRGDDAAKALHELVRVIEAEVLQCSPLAALRAALRECVGQVESLTEVVGEPEPCEDTVTGHTSEILQRAREALAKGPHLYTPLNRPPCIGAVPTGWTLVERPFRAGMGFDKRIDLPLSRWTFGAIEYDRLLTLDEVKAYELKEV